MTVLSLAVFWSFVRLEFPTKIERMHRDKLWKLQGIVLLSMSMRSYHIPSSSWSIHMTNYATYLVVLWYCSLIICRYHCGVNSDLCCPLLYHGRIVCLISNGQSVPCVPLGDGVRRLMERVFNMQFSFDCCPIKLNAALSNWMLSTLCKSDVRRSISLYLRFPILSAWCDGATAIWRRHRSM